MECPECGATLSEGETSCPDCGSLVAPPKRRQAAASGRARARGTSGGVILTHAIAVALGILVGVWITRTALRDQLEAAKDPQGLPSGMVGMPPGHPQVAPGTKAPPLTPEMLEKAGFGGDPHGGMGGMGSFHGMGAPEGMGGLGSEPSSEGSAGGAADG